MRASKGRMGARLSLDPSPQPCSRLTYPLGYEDIKHELDPRLRDVHERLIARIEEIAIAREPD